VAQTKELLLRGATPSTCSTRYRILREKHAQKDSAPSQPRSEVSSPSLQQLAAAEQAVAPSPANQATTILDEDAADFTQEKEDDGLASSQEELLLKIREHLKDAANDTEKYCHTCHKIPAAVECKNCDAVYCDLCFTDLHSSGRKAKHMNVVAWTKNELCGTCEKALATIFCEQCDDSFCFNCLEKEHNKSNPRRSKHRGWKSLSEVADEVVKSPSVTTLESELQLAEEEARLSVVSVEGGLACDPTQWAKKRVADQEAFKNIQQQRKKQKEELGISGQKENLNNGTSIQQRLLLKLDDLDSRRKKADEFQDLAIQYLKKHLQ